MYTAYTYQIGLKTDYLIVNMHNIITVSIQIYLLISHPITKFLLQKMVQLKIHGFNINYCQRARGIKVYGFFNIYIYDRMLIYVTMLHHN